MASGIGFSCGPGRKTAKTGITVHASLPQAHTARLRPRIGTSRRRFDFLVVKGRLLPFQFPEMPQNRPDSLAIPASHGRFHSPVCLIYGFAKRLQARALRQFAGPRDVGGVLRREFKHGHEIEEKQERTAVADSYFQP
jgi:hypothetical protein